MLVLRETLDAGGVEDVPHGLVAEGVGERLRVRLEHPDLPQGEGVLGGVFRGGEMRVHRHHAHLVVHLQEIHQGRQFARHEAQAVHAGVQLDVDGELLQAAPAKLPAQGLQGVEVGDARLQAALDDLGEEVRPGGEHEDGKGNTAAAQLHALDGQGNGQIISTFALHHGGELHRSVAVGVGLHEHEQLRGGPQQAAEIAVVAPACRQAQLQARKIVLPFGHIMQR